MPETTEIVSPQNELETVAEGSGLAPDLAGKLAAAFVPLAEQAASVIGESAGITVTDATQVTEIKASRAARLKLRAMRDALISVTCIEVEKTRKSLKEEWLRPGQAIDSLARYLCDRINPVEARLEEQEKFAERKEAERKAALRASREKLLAPFGVNTAFYQLADMDENTFAALLSSSRLAHEAKIAEAKRAEAERIAAENARKEEEARVRAENERLRQEAAERERAVEAERKQAEEARRAAEAEARQEREASEAKLREERSAREKLEREAKEREAAEKRRVEAEERAKRKAERAPDRDKLLAVAASVRAIVVPEMKSDAMKSVRNNIVAKAEAFATWIEQQIATLE